MNAKIEMIRKLTNCTFPEKDILIDLQYTQSLEKTVDRILEGQFLKSTVLDNSLTDADSDGIEIISVQQSQKSVAIELLSSPRPSSPVFEGEKYPVFCSSPLVIATVSKSTANLKSITKYDSLDKFSEESEDLALLEKNRCLNLQLKRGSSVKVDLSSDNDLATIPCSAPAKLNNISSTSDEFDMSFMRKRSIDPKKGAQSFRLNLPEPKLPTKVSKKTLKPLRKNNSEVNTERQTERQSKEDKQRHNNELAQEKQLEKQRKIEEKQRLLQEKEAVQAVKAANALRQKNTAADEIVVSMCNEWSQYPSSKPICESISQSGARVVISKHKLPFTLTFSRKVNRDFDFFNTQVWKPCSERIEVEPYTLLYFPAEKLSQLIKQKNGLVNNLNSAMKIYPGHTYIYLIEGLLEFYKRRKRLESKHENDLLKIAMGEKVVKRKEDIPKLLAEMPEPKAFENALTLLQNFGKGKCKIQFSPASETAGWVVSFLQQIAIFPEMQLNVQSADVKSGKDPKDTWIKMLQEISSVTHRSAEAIAKKYPTCNSLISELLTMPLDNARKLLVGIPVEPAVDGGAMKSIGVVQAKKIVDVLLGFD